MLEDGAEQGNTFEQNLGAVGHGVDNRISDNESDPTPATFWITNPQNYFIGNVAAGSKFSGFWFEVTSRVRGPSFSMHQDMVPNKLNLLMFIDNVSHSNSHGLQTYPQTGYRPESLAVFQNMKSFRNRISGIFFHAGGRLSVDGGYISDNKIGVDIDMDHSDVISNTKIVGYSSAYKAVVDAIGYSASQYPETTFCDDGEEDSPLVGIRLDSYHDGSLFGATGSTLRNVTFSGFGTGSCAGSSVLHVDSHDIRYFDTRNSVEDIIVMDDSPKINLCGGETQVAIRDKDGSMMGETGFIISDSDAILSHPDCTSIGSNTCAALCPGVCLRTMTVMVPSYYERGSLILQVYGTTSDGRPITPVSIQDFQTKPLLTPKQDSSQGRLFVSLPAGGSYHGRFSMNGETEWPLYTDLKYEDEVGSCGPDFASFTIEQLVPSQCDSLIQNGDFESGTTDFWWHVGNHGIELSNEGAEGSSKSLLAPNPDNGGRHVGLGQYLDTRCIEQGYTYILSAMVKLVNTNTGELYECNLSGYSSDDAPCPVGSLEFTNRLGEPAHHWETVGKMNTNNLEWNLMTGSYVANGFDGDAHSVFLYIIGVPPLISIQIDQVSLVRTDQTISPTAMPSALPSPAPSSKASQVPSPVPVPVAPSPFEGSNPDTITFGGEETIRLATENGVDSTVLTKEAHTGDIMLTIEIQDRVLYGDGYEPGLAIFFASETTSISDVTTDDNGFENFFEPSVVAYMTDKIFFKQSDPATLNYTWFAAKALDTTGNFASASGSKNIRNINGVLRLERSGGSVSWSYSFGGDNWLTFGAPILLPESYQFAPLKLGYRIKKNWRSSYDITTKPTIVSEGTTSAAGASGPQSYFSNDNTERIGTTCGPKGCTLALDAYNSAILSTESFSGDVSFIVKVENREIFGTGYQSGIWLFFAEAGATINTVPTGKGEEATFEAYVMATVGDKIHATIDHTWTSMKSQNGSGIDSQSGGDAYKNIEGYLKLERTGNVVSAFMSPNGNGWKAIGQPKTLPSEYAGVPIKLGLRTYRNWASGYSISVMPTVEQS